jgi:hypothetical protein
MGTTGVLKVIQILKEKNKTKQNRSNTELKRINAT